MENTILHIVIMHILLGRYYGLLLWFPEYFKRLDNKANNISSSLDGGSNSSISIYTDSMYISLAALPSVLLGIFTVNLLGGKIMLSEYLERNVFCGRE